MLVRTVWRVASAIVKNAICAHATAVRARVERRASAVKARRVVPQAAHTMLVKRFPRRSPRMTATSERLVASWSHAASDAAIWLCGDLHPNQRTRLVICLRCF